MKSRKILFIGLIMLLSNRTHAQITALSKQQMYEDFDYLDSLINTTNPYLGVKNYLFNYSISDTIRAYRSKIENCTTFTEFQLLIKSVLNSCLDGHSTMVSSYPYPDVRLFIPLTYCDGDYYIKRDFTYDSIQFNAGAKLIAINGNYKVNSEIQNLISSRYLMRWDMQRKQFYSELFFLSDRYIIDGAISLMFEHQKDSIACSFRFSDKVNLDQFNADNVKRVAYFEEVKMLYIRIPEMKWSDRNYFKKEIPRIAKNKEIEKVVIDVRYNMGGSSLVGRNVMRLILPEPILLHTKIYGNPKVDISRRYAQTHGFNNVILKSPVKELDSLEMAILLSKKESIKPFRKSIRHSGEIYIIGNEHVYSAGGAMFMFAHLSDNDKIYSIGTSTGWFLGEFTDPIHYKLTHSELEIMISPSMSMTNVNSWNNVMHDHYDFNIRPSVENYKLFYSQNGQLYDVDYLLTKDPYFEPIIDRR